MHRIDSSTVEADKFGVGKDGFTEGDTGVTAPTATTDDWMDGVQEELCNVIEHDGTALVKNQRDQFVTALQNAMIRFAVSNAETITAAGAFSGDVQAVAYDDVNDLWLFVGQAGEIQTSPDGITWTARSAAGAYAQYFLAAEWNGTNLFCIVGQLAEIQTSPDGTTWTARTAAGGFASSFHGVAHDGSVWTIVGNNGEIQTSPDGITWTARTAAGGYSDEFFGLAHNGTVFCAVGENGEIQTSPDGTTWTARTNDGAYTDDFTSVAASSAGTLLAVGTNGEIQTSTDDGVTWVARTAAAAFSSDFLGVSFVSTTTAFAVGQSGELQISIDNGVTWAVHPVREDFPASDIACVGVDAAGQRYFIGLDGDTSRVSLLNTAF